MEHLVVDHTWTESTVVDGALVERERVIRLEVSGPADLKMGMRRSLLIEEQRALWSGRSMELVAEGASGVERDAEFILRTAIYPAFIASITKHEGFSNWPISFEEFGSLPEQIGIKLEESVFKLNAHWLPQIDPKTMEQLEEARKKAMSGTSELSNG
jgi:hypothetical protein